MTSNANNYCFKLVDENQIQKQALLVRETKILEYVERCFSAFLLVLFFLRLSFALDFFVMSCGSKGYSYQQPSKQPKLIMLSYFIFF